MYTSAGVCSFGMKWAGAGSDLGDLWNCNLLGTLEKLGDFL